MWTNEVIKIGHNEKERTRERVMVGDGDLWAAVLQQQERLLRGVGMGKTDRCTLCKPHEGRDLLSSTAVSPASIRILGTQHMLSNCLLDAYQLNKRESEAPV